MNATQTRAEAGCEQRATIEAQCNHFRNPRFAQLMGSLGDLVADGIAR
jgi:hypothetical protein